MLYSLLKKLLTGLRKEILSFYKLHLKEKIYSITVQWTYQFQGHDKKISYKSKIERRQLQWINRRNKIYILLKYQGK